MNSGTPAIEEVGVVRRQQPAGDGNFIAHLEAAVQVGDVPAFITLVERTNWALRSPRDLVCAVRLALALDAPLLARRLANVGVEHYADNPEIQKMARILAPPIVTTRQASPSVDVHANNSWMEKYHDEYRGRWVALDSGRLVAAADTVSDLLKITGNVRHSGILVAKVS